MFLQVDGKATKTCEVANDEYKYGPTDFSQCKTKVTDEIDKIEKETVSSQDEQTVISQYIMEIAEESSGVMNTDNVEKTSSIIDEVLAFDAGVALSDEVTEFLRKQTFLLI